MFNRIKIMFNAASRTLALAAVAASLAAGALVAPSAGAQSGADNTPAAVKKKVGDHIVARQLHMGVRLGNLYLVRETLKAFGEKTAEARKNRLTALQAAVVYGQDDVLQLLIKQGADVRVTDDFVGGNALHHARKASTAKILLKAGLDINQKTKDGSTPLDVAIFYRRKDLAEFLRQNGGKCDTTPAAKCPR